ncbi:serine hydrolase [Flammeovirga sp. SJP92]|uniref:serine hydrolase n=1 Tax=Flammeovirga sp. SJP92 TaxID=1775430 RepID=UPI000787914C|nr:serine hydrolase [Flammeovirga sp. SJP92]KXX71850.1 hypothetical protein AVL50_03440 [Flammeovirga sp. SJP92]
MKTQHKLLSLLIGLIGMILFFAFNQKKTIDNPKLIYNKYATAKEIGLMEGFPTPVEKQVNKKNALLTPPYNRWSYLHMREIYPTAPISAAEKTYSLEKNIDTSFNHIKVFHPESKDSISWNSYFQQTYSDAIVVIKDTNIVYEKYDNGMHPDQPHQMMSVTKSFGGLLGLLAVENKLIKEDDYVVNYVPELKKAGAFSDATFREVLDMTNSMDFDETYADPTSGIRQYGAVIGWTEKEKEFIIKITYMIICRLCRKTHFISMEKFSITKLQKLMW